MKQFILHYIEKLYGLIYHVLNRSNTRLVPVLTFHWFVSNEMKQNIPYYSENKWYSSIEMFEEQIKWLCEQGYKFINCHQLQDWLEKKIDLPVKTVMLTFDDGEISQLRDVPIILNRYGAIATIFVVGKYWMDEKENIPIGAIEDTITHFTRYDYCQCKYKECIDIQAHTYNLHYRKNQKPAITIVSDCDLDKDIEKNNTNNFEYIAMPYGAYSTNTTSILSKNYKLGFAFPRRRFPYVSRRSDRYKIPRIRVDGTKDIAYFKMLL